MRCQIKWKPAKPNSVKLEGFPLVFDDAGQRGWGMGGGRGWGVGTTYKKNRAGLAKLRRLAAVMASHHRGETVSAAASEAHRQGGGGEGDNGPVIAAWGVSGEAVCGDIVSVFTPPL